MSVAENKQAIRDWIAAINRGDEAAILALTSEDFAFQTMARQPEWLLPQWNREEFAATPSTMSALMKAPIQLEVVNMIGEGDSVSLEARTDGEMLNGRRYNNRYHFVIEFKDGKFKNVREYSCSALASTCFGAIEPATPELSRMAD